MNNDGYKPTICLGFDGVIHSYVSGWKGADVVSDIPVQGAFAFIVRLWDKGFDVAIYSSRSGQEGGIEAMKAWMEEHSFTEVDRIKWPQEKPPAHLIIDDRAWCFGGIWPSIEDIRNFKPWNKK